MSPARFSIQQLLRMSAGLIVWASAFVMLYAGFSLGCQTLDVEADQGLVNPVTIMLMIIASVHGGILLLLLWVWHRHPAPRAYDESERSHRFRHRVEGLVLGLSLAGLIWIAFPVAMLPPCTG